LLAAVLLAGAATSLNATLQTQVEDYCKNSNLTEYMQTNETLRQQQRADARTAASISVTEIFTAVNNQQFGSVVSSVIAPFVLLILFIIVALCAVVFSALFICCCDRASGASQARAKCNSYVALASAVAMAAMIIVTFVFLGRTTAAVTEVNCASSAIHRDLINGVSANGMQFVGLDTLTSIFVGFKNDVGNLNAVNGDFDAIIAKKLPDLGNEAYNTLEPFYTQFKDSTTNDGSGAKSAPKTVTTLTTRINDGVDTNFKYLQQVTAALDQGARQGKAYIDPLVVQSISNTLQTVIDSLAEIASSLNNYFDQLTSILQTSGSGAKASSIIIIIVLIALIVFTLGVCMVLCLMINGKLTGLRCPVKLGILLMSIISFVMALVSLVMYLLAVASATGCDALSTTLATNNFAPLLAQWNVTNENMTKILDTCVASNGTGDLSQILGTPDVSKSFGDVNKFLDGFTQIKQVRANLTADNADSIAVNMTLDVWNKFKTGLYPDHQKAMEQLIQLNQLLKCDSKSFQFNKLNCTDAGCMSLFETATWSAPVCATPVASDIFSKLKDYQKDEEDLLNRMTTAAKGADSTPNGKYRFAFLAIVDVAGSIDKIIAALTNTFNSIQDLSAGFATKTNCTVVRQELLIIESTLCFQFAKSSYFFFVFLIIMTLMIFIFSCAACCTLHCLPEEVKQIHLGETIDRMVDASASPLVAGK